MTGSTDGPAVVPSGYPSRWTFLLATGATATAICMSALAGWQRGGSLPERLVWVAIGVVLVVCAHLLPALCRSTPLFMRGVGTLLWVACMATACYGHATFFLLAQQHAGERRASSVAPVVTGTMPVGRTLTAVMNERASVTRQLATANVQRCPRDCPFLTVRRAALSARLDALNAEADDVRRMQAVGDQAEERRDALRTDPVTARLAALVGTTVPRIDLISGLAFAAVLEGVACLLWGLALDRQPGEVETPAVTPDVVSDHHVVTSGPAPVSATDPEVIKLANDIAAGRVRTTVSDIRRHLGCSQAKAVSLRRQLAGQTITS